MDLFAVCLTVFVVVTFFVDVSSALRDYRLGKLTVRRSGARTLAKIATNIAFKASSYFLGSFIKSKQIENDPKRRPVPSPPSPAMKTATKPKPSLKNHSTRLRTPLAKLIRQSSLSDLSARTKEGSSAPAASPPSATARKTPKKPSRMLSGLLVR
eukprot:m.3240 g.3240  ORF g.3240 m.3240 type:complete len:155 (+) comp9171_c0_seq1:946-1410(+)